MIIGLAVVQAPAAGFPALRQVAAAEVHIAPHQVIPAVLVVQYVRPPARLVVVPVVLRAVAQYVQAAEAAEINKSSPKYLYYENFFTLTNRVSYTFVQFKSSGSVIPIRQ